MDLSIIIPARQEEFLPQTIEDILKNIRANTEIIVILDGYLPDPPLKADPKVTVIYNPVAVGQRAGANQGVKIARGKYIMKVDAHCAFDEGFDQKMLDAFKETGDNVTMIPMMRNLHVFDWVCEDGHRRYQGNGGPCETCGKPTKKDVVWFPKPSPRSVAFRFDKTMHFQYHSNHMNDPVVQKGLLVGFRLSFDTRMIPFKVVSLLADLANTHLLTTGRDDLWFRKYMPVYAVSLSSVDDRWRVGSSEILGVGNQFKVEGITATSVVTEVVDDLDVSSSTSGNLTDQPSISDSMGEFVITQVSEPSVTIYGKSTSPVPTESLLVNADIVKKLNSVFGGEFIYNEKTSSLHNGSITLTPIYDKEMNETMSIQGSCFMCTKEKYLELDLCGEEFNSWGQQGVEVACKTWLSGGRVISNRKTWYAHMFRTKGGDFGFPYHNPQDKINENRELSRELFLHNKWPKATRPFQWLMDKFNPPDWSITKGIIYYTDSQLDPKYAKPVVDQLVKISKEKNIPITTSALKRKLDFGVKNVCFPSLKRSFYAMFKQIVGALENSRDDIIFFCEADVLYHPSHFDFTPPDKDTFSYNQNVWLLRTTDGHTLHYDVNQLSGLCVYRETALTHFRERFKMVETEWNKIETAPNREEQEREFNRFIRNMGFEPFTHGRVSWINQFKLNTWKSALPNIDIKHGNNATGQRWTKEEYRNQNLLINWTEGQNWTVEGWDSNYLKQLQ